MLLVEKLLFFVGVFELLLLLLEFYELLLLFLLLPYHLLVLLLLELLKLFLLLCVNELIVTAELWRGWIVRHSKEQEHFLPGQPISF